MNTQNVKWHQLSTKAVEEQLHTNASCGLSRKEARSRYRKYGPNTLFDEKIAKGEVVRGVLHDPSLLLLLFVCVLSLCFSEVSAGLSALVCFACGIGFAVQIFLTKKQLQTQTGRYRIPSVCTLRDGKELLTTARNIVPGDVILLKKGDIVPADCRLISMSKDLHLLTLYPDSANKVVMHEFSKRAEKIYSYQEDVFAPQCENILYGGSELFGGSAKAIVLETGKNTFLGRMESFSLPAEASTGSCEDFVSDSVGSFLRFYSFALFLLLLPLSVIGMLTAPDNSDVLCIFLSLCALAGAGSMFFLLLRFQLPVIRLRKESQTASAYETRMVFKSSRSVKRMSELTDVFVMGHDGSSDGVFHLYRCSVGAQEIRIGESESYASLQSLCEAYLLLQQAAKQKVSASEESNRADVYGVLRRELLELSAFDTQALATRLQNVKFLTDRNVDDLLLEVETKEKTFHLLFSEKIGWVERCTFYEDHGRLIAFFREQRETLRAFAREATEQGASLQVVIKQYESQTVLLGILALRELIQSDLPLTIKEMNQNGLRVSFFLNGDTLEEKRYASVAALPEERIIFSEENRGTLSHLIENNRVFIGFDNREIFAAIRTLRKQGRRVAVLNSQSENLPLTRTASLSVACGSAFCFSEVNARSNQDMLANNCPQSLRRHADIMISRAGRTGGGLLTVLRGVTGCRATEYRLSLLLKFLLLSQFSRLVTILLSAVFGVGLMTGAQILYGGFIAESVGCLWLTSLKIDSGQLRKPLFFREQRVRNTIFDLRLWLPSIVTSAVLVLYAWILTLCGVISKQACVPFLFCSMLLLQILMLYLTARYSKATVDWKQFMIPAAFLCVPILILIAFSVAFPAVNEIFLLGDWKLATLLSLPLSPILYWIFRRLVSSFFHRTAK